MEEVRNTELRAGAKPSSPFESDFLLDEQRMKVGGDEDGGPVTGYARGRSDIARRVSARDCNVRATNYKLRKIYRFRLRASA